MPPAAQLACICHTFIEVRQNAEKRLQNHNWTDGMDQLMIEYTKSSQCRGRKFRVNCPRLPRYLSILVFENAATVVPFASSR